MTNRKKYRASPEPRRTENKIKRFFKVFKRFFYFYYCLIRAIYYANLINRYPYRSMTEKYYSHCEKLKYFYSQILKIVKKDSMIRGLFDMYKAKFP